MTSILEKEFNTVFKNNGNTFDSCFQFEEIVKEGQLKRKIKIYNKFNQLI